MPFLIIETSYEESFVSLFVSPDNTPSKTLSPSMQSKELIPSIERLLKDNSIPLESLEFIGIGNGPGSFTGTRVGVMTAKTLSFSQDIPLIPFCSLCGFIPENEGDFLTILDAKSQGFYTLKGSKQRDLVSFEEPKLLKKDTLLSLTKKVKQLISPHPLVIENKISLSSPLLKVSFNIPFINILTQKAFSEKKGLTHSQLNVCYLYHP